MLIPEIIESADFPIDHTAINAIFSAASTFFSKNCLTERIVLRFVNDAEIQIFNRDYRKKDRPTDVLSFSYRNEAFLGAENEPIGEIIFSSETLRRQAVEMGHSIENELNTLCIHGICHIFGYDHEEDDDFLKMKLIEEEIEKYRKESQK